jgi:HJR/Mrr/RecB family endonuclease
MPRRQKYHPFTEFVLITLIIIGIGSFCIISFALSPKNNLGISSETKCNVAIYAIFALIIGTPIALAVFISYKKEQDIKRMVKWKKYLEDEQEKKFRGIQIANIDSMTGIEFEQYLQRLLTQQGYDVNMTQAGGDLGVDLIASRDDDKIAIQAKRYNTQVSRRAISDAVAGKHHYDCNKGMVITNNYFSPGAIALAQSTDCILIDRDTLANWVNEFRNTNAQNSIPKEPDETEVS